MRDKLDRYYTPPALAEACVKRLYVPGKFDHATLYEPCCGPDAPFVQAFKNMSFLDVTTYGCDLDPSVSPDVDHYTHCDVEDWRPPKGIGYRIVVANPFYGNIRKKVLPAMLDFSLCVSAHICALLLPSTAIDQIMDYYPRPTAVYTIRDRPMWGGPTGYTQTAKSGAVWVVYDWQRDVDTVIVPMTWDKPNRTKQ